MIELLFLLLPVAAAYGWFMGRNSVRAEQRREQEQFSQKYVTGINLLLSDQSDKAVDLFVDILDVDSETLDTHWALGKLFRRRGEVERAIRIHQNLISRPSLSEHDRHLALFELGEDYLSAGLYDRAEKMFLDLQQQNKFKNDSLYNLLTIYESTHEWHKAIKMALKIARSDRRVEATIAQFYCELADVQEDPEAALKYYQKALKHDRNCVRASLALSRWWMGQGSYRQALDFLLKIKDQDADFLPEALPLIRDSYLALKERTSLVSFLHECMQSYPSASVMVMLAELVAEQNDVEEAERFMTRALAENPTTKGFHKLIDLHIRTADEGKARDSLIMLRNMVAERLKRNAHYHCRHCGFSGQTLYWHCPSCKAWATIKPTKGLDGE
ncbi:lipopolysaccharide assembly protein LapB [Aliidiomarina minuta]|uniref:Lipopolysaccharide assembly protein B n=1 Tax=Aliidiomarina minuta TaxID=880057 RepID=A0A432W6I2_9GAMM|nr:lipopolysaccharide assembly protein LapB [Aliidiomarina minuta]RUO25631.1 lipopolysaccharide assembly protein LapB [Aliidiomarina minuta]